MTMDSDALAREVITVCREQGLTLATSESLTAGLCAATLANIPGASNVLRGGLIVYATELKAELAGVDVTLLEERGPIDPDVAEQLALGATERCGADIGIGLTGVAGPDSQDGHPVGEVFIGLSVAGVASKRKMDVDPQRLERAMIRQSAVEFALLSLLEELKRYAGGNKSAS